MFVPLMCLATPEEGSDPLNSPVWQDIRKDFFADAPVHFDSRVVVIAPAMAEDSLHVPISVHVENGLQARRIVIFADLNPIVRVVEMEPMRAKPYLFFRMKIQQSTPVRAAVLDSAGTWHMGGMWVNASGGGCTAPSAGSAQPDWAKHLGEVRSREWTQADSLTRLRVRIRHPMDTGLVAGIPAFYLQNLDLTDETGSVYLHLTTFEPLSEDPVLGFDIPDRAGHTLRLTGKDNNGNRIDKVLP